MRLTIPLVKQLVAKCYINPIYKAQGQNYSIGVGFLMLLAVEFS